MCSSIFHIAFTLILAASTVVLLVAAFTPGWATEIYDKVNPNSTKVEKGLISVKCIKEKASSESTEDCDDFYSKADWEKAVLVLILASIAVSIVALAWTSALCVACCFKSCLSFPLPILVFVAFLLDAAALITYIAKEKSKFDNVDTESASSINQAAFDAFGYSLYLAAVGAVGLLADVVVGIVFVKCSKISPIC